MYPVVFYQIFGLLFTCAHQLQSPIDFDCKDCGARTGRRSGLATFGLWLLIGMFVAWLCLVVPLFRQIVMMLMPI